MGPTGARVGIALALALAWSSGCSWFENVPIEDLGRTDDGLSTPSEPSEPIPGKEFLEQIDPGFEGYWVGYVEDPFRPSDDGRAAPAVFPSGSTEVTLDYRFDVDFRTPVATLIFGAGPARAPERGVAYPPGVNHYFKQLRTVRDYPFTAPVVEGFAYQMTETDPRFSGYDPGNASLLTFEQLAGFAEWCSLQEPQLQGADRYQCLGAAGFAGGDPILGEPCVVFHADDTQEEVDCNFAAMCFSDLCSCTADSCQFNRFLTLSEVFLERRDDEIVGTISGGLLDSGRPGWYAPMGTLRLRRVRD